MPYEDLDELFSYISNKDKVRLVCRYILGFSCSQIAALQNRSLEAIYFSFRHSNNKFKKLKTQDELVDLLQRIFDKNYTIRL